MMAEFQVILGGIVGVLAGWLVGYYVMRGTFLRRETELRETIAHLKASKTNVQAQYERQQELFNHVQESLGKQFKLLSMELYEKKSKQMETQSKQTLGQVLEPFQLQLKQFQDVVRQNSRAEANERGQLKQALSQLLDLNQQLSRRAENLTNALTSSSKVQGTWGEIQLERILETSGLTKDREYRTQVTLKTGEGRVQRPDVVVYLPNKREIIIDAKVSLTAYEQYMSTEELEKKKMHIDMHVKSVKNHIQELTKKEYHTLLRSTVEIVFMFVPIDGAMILASSHDPDLYQYALERNIVLLSPSTLIPALRIVEQIWRHEKQSENARLIVKSASKMLDKFSLFVDDLTQVGKRLESAQSYHSTAMKKLASGRGNLIQSAKKLKEMGVSTRKSLSMEETSYEEASIGVLDDSEDEEKSLF